MKKETKEEKNSFENIEKIFHEPNRLAIMSALCASDKGISFADLKKECSLTDGNLNRHLKVLSEAKAIKINKAFVNAKPKTTITISRSGLNRFSEYLTALSDILQTAKQALPKTKQIKSAPFAKTANA